MIELHESTVLLFAALLLCGRVVRSLDAQALGALRLGGNTTDVL